MKKAGHRGQDLGDSFLGKSPAPILDNISPAVVRRFPRTLRAVVLSGEGRAASHTERDISTALIMNGFL
jgi:hypothetical protein